MTNMLDFYTDLVFNQPGGARFLRGYEVFLSAYKAALLEDKKWGPSYDTDPEYVDERIAAGTYKIKKNKKKIDSTKSQ